MKTTLFAALLCSVSLLLPCVHAQQTEVLRAEFQKRKAEAEQGDARAQLSLGYYYRDGRGVEKDLLEAAKWYRKAGEQGLLRGQLEAATYFGGEEKIKWLRKAAERNSGEAQYRLGECYEYGTGVAKDVAEAVKRYRKAAEKDYYQAQIRLGFCYQRGIGVAPDPVEAVKWYRVVAEYDHGEGQKALGDARKEAAAFARRLGARCALRGGDEGAGAQP